LNKVLFSHSVATLIFAEASLVGPSWEPLF